MSLTYFLGRLAHSLVSLMILSVLIFFCTQILPGNVANAILGENADPKLVQQLTVQLGLDQPIVIQYKNWILSALQGDFGRSYTLNQPVGEIILPRIANSAMLAVVTLAVAALIAFPLGVLAAVWRGRPAERGILVGCYLGISVPDFIRAPILILVFALPPLALFPATGFVPFSESPTRWLWHLTLPVVALAIGLLAHLVRQTRSGVIDVLNSDYARAARLRGLPEWRVVVRHVLPSGLNVALTVLALDLGYLMGSVLIVEQVFAYPGLGRMLIYAVQNRDIPLIQTATLIVGAAFAVSTFLADIINIWLNPKAGSAA